ncbi:hypothetical protein ZIOFF_032250 [Zingiber officinale]|uniref:Uncharacterized protein n=1 Tax=Zingiber officinale TaxID=94328 RepID=A0A8J5L5J6_ZINOF|nr:hypothetical protein ZIOFF_032250 [Zingiber officinale]
MPASASVIETSMSIVAYDSEYEHDFLMSRGKMKWFSSLRKALIPQCCKRDYGKGNCKSNDFGLLGSQDMESCIQNSTSLPPPIAIKEDKLMAKESEQSSRGRAYTAALATAIAAEAAGAAIRAAAEVIRITTSMTKSSTKLTKENAAIRIQSAFRGHQALLLFLFPLHSTGQAEESCGWDRRQVANNKNLVLLADYVESADATSSEIGEGWDHGSQSKEQAEAKQLNRKEAASKRERALAYAFSHQINVYVLTQWRSSSKSTVPAMNLNRGGKFVVQEASNPQLGWSWLARLMAGKPWEKKQNGSFKTPSCVGGARPAAIAAKHGSDSGSSSPAVPLSPTSSAASSRKDSLSSRRNSQCSPRAKVSARLRRHSVAGLPSVTDRNGLGRSLVELNKNHVASTQAAKTGSRLFPTVKEQPAARIRRLSLNK